MSKSKSDKPSLVDAAKSHVAPRRTWFTLLKERKPALAKEMEDVVDKWLRGELENFTSRHQLTTFLVNYDNNAIGVKESAVTDWIEQRAKSQ